MTALLPHQPVTQKGDRPSRELLEALQTSGRGARATDAQLAAMSTQVASLAANVVALDAGKADLNHAHTADEITDSTAAGRAMLMAADVAAQTALLDAFTPTAKGLVPASGGGLAVLRADGVWTVPVQYGMLAADYVLTNTAASQKLFNWSANGALTLDAGVYRFRAIIYLTGMSAASGNGTFSVLGAGTATVGRVLYCAAGVDSTTPLDAASRTGSASVTVSSAANMLTAGVGTGMIADISGMFDVTASGTIVPSIALTTAAAATVKAGSFFECQRIGNTGAAASAGWS